MERKSYSIAGFILFCSLLMVAEVAQGKNPLEAAAPSLTTGESRTFEIHYRADISSVPAGTKLLRIWFPVPQDSAAQFIKDLSFSTPPRITTEQKYGNKIAYWEINHPPAATELTMNFVCTRKEMRARLTALASDGIDPNGSYAVFQQPDRLVVVNEPIQKLSAQIVQGKTTTLGKARAVYDYVLGHMVYDKSQPGWGNGSTEFACEYGKGNCTDFHSLFISLCRAQGIASGFEIGLYLPYERAAAEPLGSYHCWAFFRVPGEAWVPVDCSEASRNPQRRDYFFGAHTSNRVALSTGRDLILDPPQRGAPLNYFVDPYAEADGKVVKTSKTWSYRDVDGTAGEKTSVVLAR